MAPLLSLDQQSLLAILLMQIEKKVCRILFSISILTFCLILLYRNVTWDQAEYDWRFGYDAKRVKGLVDFQIYTDDLAKQMGSLPPLRKLFFQKPRVWLAIMFGPVRQNK